MIFEELKRGKDTVWLSVLRDITGQWPVPRKHEANGRLMIADWLSWWGNANQCGIKTVTIIELVSGFQR